MGFGEGDGESPVRSLAMWIEPLPHHPVGTCNSWANLGRIGWGDRPRQNNIEGEMGEFSICRYAGQN